ncbi:hypothetical protein UYSO10_1667 [Kosakonia radicincitans]|nr:hypothetical protein UYSO10_1667 [Kosakonia radicincitans]
MGTPPYFLRYVQNVASEMPVLRQNRYARLSQPQGKDNLLFSES